jgi:hypothetical protein
MRRRLGHFGNERCIELAEGYTQPTWRRHSRATAKSSKLGSILTGARTKACYEIGYDFSPFAANFVIARRAAR